MARYPTVRQAVESYCAARRLLRTSEEIEAIMLRLSPYWAMSLKDLGPKEIEAVIDPSWSPGTRAKYLMYWRSMVREAGLRWPGARLNDPTVAIARLPREVKAFRGLSEEEEGRLLSRMEGEPKDHVEFALLTGLRYGTQMGLTWGDVDLASGLIRIPAGRMKARRDFTLPLLPRAVEILQSRSRNGSDNRVWTRRDPRPGFRRAAAAIGIHELRWHDLRATWITRLLERGCPIHIVQRLADHASIATTLRYERSRLDTVREAFLRAMGQDVAKGGGDGDEGDTPSGRAGCGDRPDCVGSARAG